MEISKWYGYIPMILFIGITAIALLNFLIGVISNVYSKLSTISIGLYLKNLIDIRQTLENDNRYSSLVSAIPPFNIVILLFSPFIIWFQSPRLNKVLLHYNYVVVLVIAISVYLFLGIL